MSTPMLIETITDWYCPNCIQTDQTKEARPHTRMHTCPGTRGMSIPFLRVGTRAKIEARDRDDYVGDEIVQTDQDGRPIMSVVTTRWDGSNDVQVYAPVASATIR